MVRRLVCLLIFLALTQPVAALAQGPVPPCADAASIPAPTAPGAVPAVQVWHPGDLPAQWMPPACSGWTVPGYRLLTAVSARIDGANAVQLFLTRLAGVSQMNAIRFWAVRDSNWQNLVHEAHALEGPPPGKLRADFTEADLVPGRPLDYTESDNGTGEDHYRMTVLVRTPTRVVVTTENTETIRYFLLPLFHPGELQALYVLAQQPDRHWVFYCLTRAGAGASSLISSHAPSVINRAVAMYRYFAGIPTDMEPPAAR